ncbi:GNAT family N-acetyltransferase [Sutcliffiella rhizosphaerae]|uniref:N-acetyltransferase domain-containing protein n=1 Tax=Sutcliffiella rhizosphaerae TaxID=2880967 RepID=A0ABM8YNK8_9BACI|nr:GNAT family N-acetyltransferase [Sutcliffiella rhizosphaerae]CAG9621517.1 hypothetical protein BACCIP111883_02290 [Sutcliffiella rhizosphaerae]
MNIQPIYKVSKVNLIKFFTSHWGSPEMVISSGTYDCSTLDGFVFFDETGNLLGVVTYILKNKECEIISLDSLQERRGIGAALMNAVEELAKQHKCTYIKLITTNDNLVALKFYQKRGYKLSRLLRNAVAEARKIKPEIPLKGNDGIPIRDELELVKDL